MLKSIKPHYVIMLLFAATVGLYYGSLIEVYFRSNIISIDDRMLMDYLFNHQLNLREMFSTGGFGKYYRPFLVLSFMLDQQLNGDTIFSYRLTNVLIHAFNVILLYLTAKTLLKHETHRNEISFFAALLFAVHPVAVESVAWISGRADPLAIFWSLLAIIFYLLGRERGRWYLLLLSFFCAVGAALSKEVGIAAPIVIAAWELFYSQGFGYKRENRYLPIFIAFFVMAAPLYLIFRHFALAAGDVGLGLVKNGFSGERALTTLQLILASFGFYLKKFICPFPLNLTIDKINTGFYAVVGLLVLFALGGGLFVQRAKKHYFFFLWAMIGIGPAAMISFADVAWTSWAERYLYYSLAPLSILAVMLVVQLFEFFHGRAKPTVTFFVYSILLVFAVSSFQRSFLWNDDLRLWRDAHKKAPDFIYATVGYANALKEKENVAEAERVLNEAQSLTGVKHILFLTLGHISRTRGEYERAKVYYLEALKEARADKRLILTGPYLRGSIFLALASLDLEQGEKAHEKQLRARYYVDAIKNYREAYREDSSNNFLLYRIAKMYLAIGFEKDAAKYFREFIDKWGDDHYKQAAEKMLKSIETKV